MRNEKRKNQSFESDLKKHIQQHTNIIFVYIQQHSHTTLKYIKHTFANTKNSFRRLQEKNEKTKFIKIIKNKFKKYLKIQKKI